MQEDMRLKMPAAREPKRQAWTITRGSAPGFGDLLRLSDGQEVIEYRIPETATFDAVKDALIVLFDKLRGDRATGHRSPDADAIAKVTWQIKESLAVRHLLADTAAKIDALIKRLPHTDAHTVRVVSPAEIDREGDIDIWYLDPEYQGHDAPFAMGDAVTDSSAYRGLFQVLSVGQRYWDKKIELRLKRHPGFVFDRNAF